MEYVADGVAAGAFSLRTATQGPLAAVVQESPYAEEYEGFGDEDDSPCANAGLSPRDLKRRMKAVKYGQRDAETEFAVDLHAVNTTINQPLYRPSLREQIVQSLVRRESAKAQDDVLREVLAARTLTEAVYAAVSDAATQAALVHGRLAVIRGLQELRTRSERDGGPTFISAEVALVALGA